MKILGISCYYHDSSACLIDDGKVVSAAAEERFTRKKHDSSFPLNAINFCLDKNNLKIEDIDYIAFYEKPVLKFERFIKYIILGFPKTYFSFISLIPAWIKGKILVLRTIRKKIGYKKQVFFISHHVSHAGSFFASPFEEAAILVVDGVGEFTTSSYGYGKGNKIYLKKEINFPGSIGLLYSAITSYLGFSVNDSEYKVMGLSAYGKTQKLENEYYDKLKKVIDIKDDGSFKLDLSYFEYQFGQRMCSKKMFELLGGFPRKENEDVTDRHKDIAAALQIITEEVVVKILNRIKIETGLENLVFGGGVALNSVLNGKILNKTDFKNVWILPDPGDGGTSIGCALYLYNQILDEKRSENLKSAYLGPEFSDEYVKDFLDRNNIKYTQLKSKDETISKTARLIYENKVIGWFQGKMEFGPRALGNRSILANPVNQNMQEILNLKVKHREAFRPFAPVVTREDMDKYFLCDKNFQIPCNFMLMVYPIKEEWRKFIPAVTHVDGSGRIQTIEREQNYEYYSLIKEFEKLSGFPILVNTSFNVRGEPIVCSPEDAYRCMMGTEIDCLVINNFLINRQENLKDVWESKKRQKIEKMNLFSNEIKRFIGVLMVSFAIFINQILISNPPIKFLNFYKHRFISSLLEIFLFIVGGSIIFYVNKNDTNGSQKTRKMFGGLMVLAGLIFNPLYLNSLIFKDLFSSNLKSTLVFFVWLVFFIIGMVLFLRPDILSAKKVFKKWKEILLMIIVLLLTDFSLSFIVPPAYTLKGPYGWGTNQSRVSHEVQDTENVKRNVTVQYFQNGFKRWGETNTTKKKILILGDSFTQTVQVNNGEEWFAYMEKAFPNVEFFVYGGGGYGSLQEYMVINDFIDKINPDIVLLQFCENDFGNNYYPYDKAQYGRNNLAMRPYLENDKIVYRVPVWWNQIRKYSAIMDKFLAWFDIEFFRELKKDPKLYKPVISKEISEKSFQVTKEIMEMIKSKVGKNRQLYMFSTAPIVGKTKFLCEATNLNCIDVISNIEILKFYESSPFYTVDDHHWNLEGNRLVGQELVRYFNKNSIFYR